jgi:hypothetical protein
MNQVWGPSEGRLCVAVCVALPWSQSLVSGLCFPSNLPRRTHDWLLILVALVSRIQASSSSRWPSSHGHPWNEWSHLLRRRQAGRSCLLLSFLLLRMITCFLKVPQAWPHIYGCTFGLCTHTDSLSLFLVPGLLLTLTGTNQGNWVCHSIP